MHISGLCLVMLWSVWPISWRSTPKDWWPNSGTSASLRNGCGRPRLAPTPPLGRPRFTTHKRVPSGEPITKCATCCPLCGGTWSTPVLPPAWSNSSPNADSSGGAPKLQGAGQATGLGVVRFHTTRHERRGIVQLRPSALGCQLRATTRETPGSPP